MKELEVFSPDQHNLGINKSQCEVFEWVSSSWYSPHKEENILFFPSRNSLGKRRQTHEKHVISPNAEAGKAGS